MSMRVVIAVALLGAGCDKKPSAADRTPIAAPAVADASIDASGLAEDACSQAANDAAAFPPVLAVDAPERDWDLAMRRHVLAEDCEHGWPTDLKRCIGTRTVAQCFASLDPAIGAQITTRLQAIDDLATEIFATRKTPAAFSCKQVVAAHYGDEQWDGRLDGFDARARKQMMVDSRALMLKACTAEAWDEITRACLALGAADLCFIVSPVRRQWGFPADGSVRSLGIPDCDAYDAAVAKLAACDKTPASTRDSLVRMSAALKATIAAAPASDRARRGVSCKAALASIADIAARAGC